MGRGRGTFEPSVVGTGAVCWDETASETLATIFASTLDIAGTADVEPVAPTTGPLTGFVIYEGPGLDPGATHESAGGHQGYYEGTVYLPTQDLELTGGSVAEYSSAMTMYVAYSFKFTGGGDVHIAVDRENTSVPIPRLLFVGRHYNVVRRGRFRPPRLKRILRSLRQSRQPSCEKPGRHVETLP